MRHALASLAVALVAVVLAPTCWSAELLPSEVARTLDITSFRNSIRPGLKPGTKTLAQNEFTEMDPVEGDANSVEVWLPDRSWLFEITVLRSEGDTRRSCVSSTRPRTAAHTCRWSHWSCGGAGMACCTPQVERSAIPVAS